MANMRPSWAERVLHQNRMLAIVLMALLFALAAVYTVMGVGMKMSALEMTAMSNMRDMPGGRVPGSWSLGYLGLVFLMWWVMMVAMMLPSVAPTVLLYTRLMERGCGSGTPHMMLFLLGYLLAWAAFSLVATLLHWGAEGLGLVSTTMMTLIETTPGAVLLICAGLFQFTPLKDRCLVQCQSPAAILTRYYRPGPRGALRLGLLHGAFCLGCCWALMALLFVGGVMNLY
ncbi:DUF2182 domain-containing protein [Tritonibacter litoralis]|uniref:DUF2182 domain-containing protein n=1 Tax=Tritonibacter litoralis TaxID=2662264 RepID=UPI001BE4B0E6|nr:DUF2182 domain-containing protein [Tritonibacter litoralis]